jgi:hypothetical protein
MGCGRSQCAGKGNGSKNEAREGDHDDNDM